VGCVNPIGPSQWRMLVVRRPAQNRDAPIESRAFAPLETGGRARSLQSRGPRFDPPTGRSWPPRAASSRERWRSFFVTLDTLDTLIRRHRQLVARRWSYPTPRAGPPADRGRAQRARDSASRPQEPGLAVRRRRRPAGRPDAADSHARAALHRSATGRAIAARTASRISPAFVGVFRAGRLPRGARERSGRLCGSSGRDRADLASRPARVGHRRVGRARRHRRPHSRRLGTGRRHRPSRGLGP
jgi:hypothetical protein